MARDCAHHSQLQQQRPAQRGASLIASHQHAASPARAGPTHRSPGTSPDSFIYNLSTLKIIETMVLAHLAGSPLIYMQTGKSTNQALNYPYLLPLLPDTRI